MCERGRGTTCVGGETERGSNWWREGRGTNLCQGEGVRGKFARVGRVTNKYKQTNQTNKYTKIQTYKQMQTNKRRVATTALHGGEDTRQEMTRFKRRERGRGECCERREANTGSKQKIMQLPKQIIRAILIQTNL